MEGMFSVMPTPEEFNSAALEHSETKRIQGEFCNFVRNFFKQQIENPEANLLWEQNGKLFMQGEDLYAAVDWKIRNRSLLLKVLQQPIAQLKRIGWEISIETTAGVIERIIFEDAE